MQKTLFIVLLTLSAHIGFAANIKFQINSRYKNQAIENVEIILKKSKKGKEIIVSGFTDSLGTLEFKKLKKGKYWIVMKSKDYEGYSEPLKITQEEMPSYRAVLNPTTEKKIVLMGGFILDGDSLNLIYRKTGSSGSSLPDIDISHPAYKKFTQNLARTIIYPQGAIENGVEGKVYLMMFLDSDGYIIDAGVVRSVDRDLDTEALFTLFLIENIGVFNEQEKERNPFYLPIKFALE